MDFVDSYGLIKRGLQACEVRPRELLLLSVLGVLAALFRVVSMSLFLPLVYSAFSDSSTSRGRFASLLEVVPLEDFNLTYLLSGTVLLTGIVAALLGYLAEYLESRLSYHGQSMLSRRIFRRFLSYGQAYSDRNRPNSQLRNLRQIPRQMSRQVKVLGKHLRATMEILVYSCALLILSWQVAVACFIFLVSYYFFFGRLVSWVDSISYDEDQIEDASEDRAADVLLNLPLVREAGTAHEEKQEWKEFQKRSFQQRKRAYRYEAALNPARQLLTLLAMLVFVLGLSFTLDDLQAHDVARFVIFFLFLRRLMAAFSKVLNAPTSWSKYQDVMSQYAVLMERSDKGIVSSGDENLQTLTQPIEISNLQFSYADGPALKSVSVNFPVNTCTAVVGLSGSGKSTLLRLLARQYEIDGGGILLNGRDIGAYSWDSLARQVVLLGSDPQFFNKSIEYNLCYGRDDVEQEDLDSALEQSNAAEFVSELEQGLQTVMGSQDQPFSRGQLQRLGIARLLLQREASLLLLDEATSALDEITEKFILRRMMARPDTTIIYVTHRTTGIDPDMHVAVFDRGQVVEQGSRRQLESSEGSYFSRLCEFVSGERPESGR